MLAGWKTLIGAGVVFAAEALAMFGITIEDVAGVSNSIIVLVGVAITVYGRLVSKTPGPLAKPPE